MYVPPRRCPHCHVRAPRTPNRLLGHAVVALAWTAVMVYVFLTSLLGPLAIGLLPVLIAAGIATITVAHSWAYPDLQCDACGKMILSEGELIAAIPPEPAAPPQEQPLAA